MKFWELVSAFRTDAIGPVLSSPPWAEPYGRWYADFSDLVRRQDRDVLDALVPLELSREVARRSSLRFVYHPGMGISRETWLDGMDGRDQVVEMTALQVHDAFGGAAIEEVLEFGSLSVKDAGR